MSNRESRRCNSSRGRGRSSAPEESFSRIINKVVPKGPIRIEDRLMNYQIQLTRKIEALKLSAEQEKLRELQEKPKILNKSRILADIHEKKYFSPVKVREFVKEDDLIQKPEPQQVIVVESVPFNAEEKPAKKRSRSELGFSVIEKSKEFYLENKEARTGANGVENKIKPGKNIKKIETNNKCLKEEILTPQSVETHADSVEQKAQKIPLRALAPYQVKVSYPCGIDLKRFLKRSEVDN